MFPGFGDDDHSFTDAFGSDANSYSDFGDWNPFAEDSPFFSRYEDEPQQPANSSPLSVARSGTPGSSPDATLDRDMTAPGSPMPTTQTLLPPVAAATSQPMRLTEQTVAQMRKVGAREKKASTRLPTHAVQAMKKWILVNNANPFPTYDQKKMWMNHFNLTMEQVKNFMANNRARLLGRLKDRTTANGQAMAGSINGVPVWITLRNPFISHTS
jgi:hypothetical protein